MDSTRSRYITNSDQSGKCWVDVKGQLGSWPNMCGGWTEYMALMADHDPKLQREILKNDCQTPVLYDSLYKNQHKYDKYVLIMSRYVFPVRKK